MNNKLFDFIKTRYYSPPSDKAQKYINHFYGKIKKGDRIHANTNYNMAFTV